jgi:uncharacterized protein (DUF305 family)
VRFTVFTLRKTRLAAVAASAALTFTLAACGGGKDSTVTNPAAGASSSDTSAISEQHNDADVTFVQDMHPHHAGALAMAELAADRAENAQVKQLAARIADAQGPEMDQMMAMAKAWDVELAEGGGHGGGHGGGEMDADAAKLEPLSGAEFDRQFLTLMIAHHEGALPMAQTELDNGTNQQAEAMAQDIVTTQTAEIAEMEQLLTQL